VRWWPTNSPVRLWEVLFAAGAAVPLASNGGALAMGVVSVLILPSLARRPEPTPFFTEVREGLRWLRHHRLLRALSAVGARLQRHRQGVVSGFSAIDRASFALLMLFGHEILKVDQVGFGLLSSIGAGGSVLGGVTAARLSQHLGTARALLAASV
jgi:hypothetical protein